AQLLAAKRQHWSVENSLHWVLDVDFGEDNMRMRTGFAAENMNILRHMALDLLKSETSYKGSLKLKMKKCALSHDYLLKVFAFS
ncbi:MAG: ISAs1 family transposase, partial [Clostridia bacterium]|nr:ISAs1 family transposase [Clostridia bacterium]